MKFLPCAFQVLRTVMPRVVCVETPDCVVISATLVQGALFARRIPAVMCVVCNLWRPNLQRFCRMFIGGSRCTKWMCGLRDCVNLVAPDLSEYRHGADGKLGVALAGRISAEELDCLLTH